MLKKRPWPLLCCRCHSSAFALNPAKWLRVAAPGATAIAKPQSEVLGVAFRLLGESERGALLFLRTQGVGSWWHMGCLWGDGLNLSIANVN